MGGCVKPILTQAHFDWLAQLLYEQRPNRHDPAYIQWIKMVDGMASSILISGNPGFSLMRFRNGVGYHT